MLRHIRRIVCGAMVIAGGVTHALAQDACDQLAAIRRQLAAAGDDRASPAAAAAAVSARCSATRN